VFVFATYYSISALVGAYSRNTILAVIATIGFWVLCFSIGTAHNWISGTMARYRIARIAPAGEHLVCADEINTMLVWNAEEKKWTTLFAGNDQEDIRNVLMLMPVRPPPMVGPVYDERNNQVVAATPSFKNFGRMALVSARPGVRWKLTEGPPTSGSPIALLAEADGRPILVSNSGVARVRRDVSSGAIMLRMPGLSIPLATAESLEDAGPQPAQYWGAPAAAAIDVSNGRLIVYTRGELSALAANQRRKYEVAVEKKILKVENEPVVLAAGGGKCFVMLKSGEVLGFSTETLEAAGEFELSTESPPRSAVMTPDGARMFVLCHDGRLHQLDVASGKVTQPRLKGQGDVSGIAVDSEGKLFVASRAMRVIKYDAATLKPLETFAPPLNLQEETYYYAIAPLYAVLPKPGEFYKTVQYLLTGQETSAEDEGNLAHAQQELNPWGPIWSGLAFQVVMLGLGCLYIQWQEF
jgi:hypothetical protein